MRYTTFIFSVVSRILLELVQTGCMVTNSVEITETSYLNLLRGFCSVAMSAMSTDTAMSLTITSSQKFKFKFNNALYHCTNM